MTDRVKAAAMAMAELYVWDAVQELLEGGTRPTTLAGQRAANRVIETCKREGQRCLRKYDEHRAAALKGG